MRLDQSTWYEVEDYLEKSDGIIIPTGSTEQHGPMGVIGTDAICAAEIASRGAKIANALVAPVLAYTPAPFNMDFPGTISISEPLFEAMVVEIIEGLTRHGFSHIYFLNGHGANIAPIERAASHFPKTQFKIASWWSYDAVNTLRQEYYGDWEGMHATPSEISITQAIGRNIEPELAKEPPEKLSADFMKQHAGDKHGEAGDHRKQFPDGRVGSHSALARAEHGQALLEAASVALAEDFTKFLEAK